MVLTGHNEINGKIVEDSGVCVGGASAGVLAEFLHRHRGNRQRGSVMIRIVATEKET